MTNVILDTFNENIKYFCFACRTVDTRKPIQRIKFEYPLKDLDSTSNRVKRQSHF